MPGFEVTMEIVVWAPLIVGLVALGRVAHLKGWNGLIKVEFRPRIPVGAKYTLGACVILQLGAGLLMQFKVIEVSLARILLSPTWASLALSLVSGWVLGLNWGRKG